MTFWLNAVTPLNVTTVVPWKLLTKTQRHLDSQVFRSRLRLKCDGTWAKTRFGLTAFEMWWHMRRNQISSYCVWNVMSHAQKQDFVLLRLKCNGTCAENRFRLTVFEMWWHMRRNQISSYCVWNVMAHAQKPDFVLLRLKCDGTRAETRFRLSAKWTSPFKSLGGVSSVYYWQPWCAHQR